MPDKTQNYVALLRAINVGKRQIKMDILAKIFRDAGMDDVKTLIASGNVRFSSKQLDESELATTLERAIEATVGFKVEVMIRTSDRMRQLVELDPFPKPLEDDTEAYVAFLYRKPESVPELPHRNEDEQYSILLLDGADLFMMATMLPIGRRGTIDKYLLKHFGKITTTRNWKTVLKLAAM